MKAPLSFVSASPLLLGLLLLPFKAPAQNVAWKPVVDIRGDADLSTLGTPVDAIQGYAGPSVQGSGKPAADVTIGDTVFHAAKGGGQRLRGRDDLVYDGDQGRVLRRKPPRRGRPGEPVQRLSAGRRRLRRLQPDREQRGVFRARSGGPDRLRRPDAGARLPGPDLGDGPGRAAQPHLLRRRGRPRRRPRCRSPRPEDRPARRRAALRPDGDRHLPGGRRRGVHRMGGGKGLVPSSVQRRRPPRRHGNPGPPGEPRGGRGAGRLRARPRRPTASRGSTPGRTCPTPSWAATG